MKKFQIKVMHIVGARPQFIKMASVARAIDKYNSKANAGIKSVILHTGQHYDDNMSSIFFQQLDISAPDYNLNVGSCSHGIQTAEMISKIEKVILEEKPKLVLLYGDTNSTLSGALAAAKIKYSAHEIYHRPYIAHIEAGLRSYDKHMPEEINRVLTDHLSDLLFCPTKIALRNLEKEGINSDIYEVGDVMYDSIVYYSELSENRSQALEDLKLESGKYYLLTIHRAENTESVQGLRNILEIIDGLSMPVIFPVHPRTRKILTVLKSKFKNILPIPPVSYLDMLFLEKKAALIFTDSGGVQKEAYFLKVPCITLRDRTEWLETEDLGWNKITGVNKKKISGAISTFYKLPRRYKKGLYGDGKASEIIVNIISKRLR